MPNWCSNNLEVSGTKEDLDEFVNKFYASPANIRRQSHSDYKTWEPVVIEPGYYFWNIISPHDEVLDEYFSNGRDGLLDLHERLAVSNNWYEWNNRNWGTKWDISPDSSHFERNSDTTFTGWFDTAWSPPIPFVAAASARHPHLLFELDFVEESMDYAGTVVVRNGRIVSETEHTIDHDYRIEQNEYCSECSWLAECNGIEESYAEDARVCEMSEAEIERFAELHPISVE